MSYDHEFRSHGHGLDSVLICTLCGIERNSKAGDLKCPVKLERALRKGEASLPERCCNDPECTFYSPVCETARREHAAALCNGMPPSGRFA